MNLLWQASGPLSALRSTCREFTSFGFNPSHDLDERSLNLSYTNWLSVNWSMSISNSRRRRDALNAQHGRVSVQPSERCGTTLRLKTRVHYRPRFSFGLNRRVGSAAGKVLLFAGENAEKRSITISYYAIFFKKNVIISALQNSNTWLNCTEFVRAVYFLTAISPMKRVNWPSFLRRFRVQFRPVIKLTSRSPVT